MSEKKPGYASCHWLFSRLKTVLASTLNMFNLETDPKSNFFTKKITIMMSERKELFIDYLERRQRYIKSLPNRENLSQSDIFVRGMVLWSYSII